MGAKFAGGKIIKGAQATGKFGGGESLLAVKPAEEIACEPFAFLRVAFNTAGNQVAIRIAAELDPRHDVIEAPPRRRNAAETVEAEPPLAGVDGLAERASLQKVRVLEVEGGRRSGRESGSAAGRDRGWTRAGGGNLGRQADLNEMTGFGAFHEAQDAESHEAADGFAHGSSGDADGAG